jgi:tape measure domain-containing protein
MADKVGSIYVDIGANIAEFNQKLKSATMKLESFGKKAEQMGRDMTLRVTAPIVGIGTAAVLSFGRLERLGFGMEAVMGSAEAARKEMELLREVAKLPGLGIEEAIQGSVNLQAAGFSAELARASLMGFGNALATVGKGKADLDGVILALTQIAAKGKVMGQELRQLQERLPQIRQIMLQAFGTDSGEEIEKMGISATDFVAMVVQELQKLPPVTGGILNAFENMSDSITLALMDLGDVINETFQLEQVAVQLGEFLQDLVSKFRQLTPEGQKMAIAIAAIAASIGPLLVGVGALSIALSGLGTVITFLTGPIGIAIAAVGALAAAFIYLYDNWELIKERFQDKSWLINTLIDMVKFAIKYNPFGILIEAYNALARFLGAQEIPDVFAGMMDALDSLKVEMDKSHRPFGSFGDAIKNGLKKGLEAFGLINDEIAEIEQKKINIDVDVSPSGSGGVEQQVENMLGNRSLGVDFIGFERSSSTMLDLLNPINQQMVALGEQFDILSQKAQVFGMTSEELAANQLNLVTTELNNLIESGQTGGEYFDFLTQKMQELKDEANTMPTAFENVKSVFEEMEGQMVNGFMRIGDAFGQSAQDGRKATMQVMKQLLTQAIGQYVLKALADPKIPLLASLALAAGGTAAVSAIFSGIPAFAEGGAVTSPTLAMIGEKPGSRGEAIIPFEKIPKLFDKMSGGANKMMVEVRGVLDGDVIRLVQDRAIQDNSLVR